MTQRLAIDWSETIEIAKELAPEHAAWAELSAAVASRIGRTLGGQTLARGLRRELEREFPTYASFRYYATGGERELGTVAPVLLDYLMVHGRTHTLSLLDLCDRFDRSPASVIAAAEALKAANYNVLIADDRQSVALPSAVPASYESIPVEMWTEPDRVYRFGVVSDTHLCNRHERLDALNAMYDLYAEEGIETVLHAGNLIDGEFRWNRHELLAHGVEGQLMYVVANYPKRDGIVTKFITGDCHEGWFSKDIGLDIGRHMHSTFKENERGDLQWLGHIEVDLELHPDNPQAKLRICHPGGGSAYAISYPLQKHVESWQGGEKPAVAIFGHYHKEGKFYPREVHCILAACFCDQTSFMRKYKLAAHVGGELLEIHLTKNGGVGRVKYEFVPFYDQGYYKAWDFRSMYQKPTDEVPSM